MARQHFPTLSHKHIKTHSSYAVTSPLALEYKLCCGLCGVESTLLCNFSSRGRHPETRREGWRYFALLFYTNNDDTHHFLSWCVYQHCVK